MIYEVEVSQYFGMIQQLASNPTGHTVNQFLNIQQTITVNRKLESVKQFLNIGQIIEVRRSITNVSVVQNLELNQHFSPRSHEVSVTHLLAMYHNVYNTKEGEVAQTLNLQQVIDVELAKSIKHTLLITQTIGVVCVRNRTVTQTFSMSSNVGVYKDDENFYSLPDPSVSGPNAPEC